MVLLGIAEHLANDTCALPDVLINDGRGNNLDERSGHVVCHCTGQECLASTWWTVEEDAFWSVDADPLEQLRVGQGKLDHLTHLPDLLCEATHIAVRDLTRILVEHAKNHRIHLPGKLSHDRERRHIKGDTRTRNQLRFVQLNFASHHIARAAGGLDNEALIVKL